MFEKVQHAAQQQKQNVNKFISLKKCLHFLKLSFLGNNSSSCTLKFLTCTVEKTLRVSRMTSSYYSLVLYSRPKYIATYSEGTLAFQWTHKCLSKLVLQYTAYSFHPIVFQASSGDIFLAVFTWPMWPDLICLKVIIQQSTVLHVIEKPAHFD